MEYIICKNGWYHFNRRVPIELAQFDPRRFVQKSLKTDSRKIAVKKAALYNQHLEAYWHGLVSTNQSFDTINYKVVTDQCRYFGYNYFPIEDLVTKPIMELVTRLFEMEKRSDNKSQVEALLGGASTPHVTINDALERYWDLSKHLLVDRSPDQIRKWRNPLIKAIKNLVNCVGNKPIHELSRDDLLKFRDWWIERIVEEKLRSSTARKDFIHVKIVIAEVARNVKIKIDFDHIFSDLPLPKDDAEARRPFETDYIISLFATGKLDGLEAQAKYMLFASAETGAGCSELVGLRPQDIRLNHAIPHISIEPYEGHKLKTKFRKRIIPLVGYALEAFSRFPDGFTKYKGSPDYLSNTIGKYLRENDLLPSEYHSAYSLRHSFQDRLTNADVPDRTQVDLMGHQFDRQKYGTGPTLEKKADWLRKIQLKCV
jgi:integrase